MPTAEPHRVTRELLLGWPLPGGDDKQSRGTVLVVGGGSSTPGAVLLAGEAALRAGAGRLQIATGERIAGPMSVAVPEARVVALPQNDDGAVGRSAADLVVREAADVTTALLGPGLQNLATTVELMTQVIPALETTVVVDAFASAYVTEHPDGLRHLEGRCVLTVNPTELARVLRWDEERVADDQTGATLAAAAGTGAVVLCGGSEKTVADPNGDCWALTVGGPGLGVSGSGDVSAGIVAGLTARGAAPAQAAVWGSYLHGVAGERLAVTVGPIGFLARELAEQVPQLLAELGDDEG